MSLGFGSELCWQCEVSPIFRLLWQSMNDWDAKFVAGQHLLEVLLPAFSISAGESKLFDLLLVLLEEQGSIEALIRLLPHFHDEEMRIQSIFSLFG